MFICELIEKHRTRELQYSAKSIVKDGSDMTAQMMQSDMNLYKTYRIVGCKIVCNIFQSL